VRENKGMLGNVSRGRGEGGCSWLGQEQLWAALAVK
jgi:hypothetical protein